jgi:hypothetical protein
MQSKESIISIKKIPVIKGIIKEDDLLKRRWNKGINSTENGWKDLADL